MINLTVQEREKFSSYCRQEGESAVGMVEQASKLRLGEVFEKRYRMEAGAYLFVAKHLSGGEETEIRG